jgi:hypothetical protein
MGLVVSARVIQELIADGEYLVECIEQREHGKVAVTFALRARALPYSIQIETNDNKLEGLFRALLREKEVHSKASGETRIGGQVVPIVEVGSLPADAPKKPKRHRAAVSANADAVPPVTSAGPTARRRASTRQLILMPQDPPLQEDLSRMQPKRRRPPKSREGSNRS